MAIRKNGCWGHAPYKDEFSSYGLDTKTGEIRLFTVPNPNKKPCQYWKTELGRQDSGCTGCEWRNKDD